MFDTKEPKEEAQNEVLCGKSEKISLDLPQENSTLQFNYAEYEKLSSSAPLCQKEPSDALATLSKILLVQSESSSLLEQKRAVEKECALFVAQNGALATDSRFSDTYYFRLSRFYALTGDFEKETDCLSRIKNQQNTEYTAALAENALRKNEHTEENLARLRKLNTKEACRTLSGYYATNGDYAQAEQALEHYIATHESIPYEIYFQYAYLCVRQGKAEKALHYARAAFFALPTAQSATLLTMLYLLQATKQKAVIEKARHWAHIAVSCDISFSPALRLYVNLLLEKEPEKTATMLERYLSLSASKKDDFYFDAKISYAKCAYVQEKFGTTLERLSVLLQDENCPNPAAVWNNSALCNEGLGKLERAEKNIARALESYKGSSTPHSPLRIIPRSDKALQAILTNYMRILNRQGKWKETVHLFETENGAKDFLLTEQSYLQYFAEYTQALRATGDAETYFAFLSNVFLYDYPNEDERIKVFAANDMLRAATLSGTRPEIALKSLAFLKQYHKENPQSCDRAQVLNNIVFTSLEFGLGIEADTFQSFVSTIGSNPCNTATYGLYLMRTQHQTERGLTYYEKAIEEARNENEAALVQELKLKKDLEEARDELYHGEKKAARRLLESITKKATQNLQGYTLKAKYLLEDC